MESVDGMKEGKTVLVVGSGGREYALAWKLSMSPQVGRVIVAPGNDGFPSSWERWKVSLSSGESAWGSFEVLARKAQENGVDLAVIGPDNPLADGIVDVFRQQGIPAFGPTKAAARIEASKSFAKEVMQAAGVPTAEYRKVRSIAEAQEFIENSNWKDGWVIKADGLAFGKGVQICPDRGSAMQAALELIPISGSLVIEERLFGEEVSWMAFCDGKRCALLEPSRDYKRLRDGDQGPNTGGMGAFSPIPGVMEGLGQEVRNRVFLPVLREMEERGCPFQGLLYAGLMLDQRDPGRFWVLEFNSRFGDPETQVLLPRMSDDLYAWCEACARGDISSLGAEVKFHRDYAVVVIGAAKGYPDAPEKGEVIRGIYELDPSEAEQVPGYFWAGVSAIESWGGEEPEQAQLQVAGGRVVGALGMGVNLETARAEAYFRLKSLDFPGMQYRTDIGKNVKPWKKQAGE